MPYIDTHCTYTEDADHYYFTGPCCVTGKLHTIAVPKQGLFNYRNGALAQDAFPNMSADDREFLKNGYSKEGWDIVMGPEE